MSNPYLESSPHAVDRGNLIGKDPRNISLKDLKALGHPESYPKVIREFCKSCCGGVSIEVLKCPSKDCTLWPMRMGRNPFDSRSKNSKPATTAIARASLSITHNTNQRSNNDQ